MAWRSAVRSPSRAARNSRVSSSTATDDTGGNPVDPQRRLPRMTCMQIHQAISARLDGEDPGLDEPTVYAHLAGCADCRAFAASAPRGCTAACGSHPRPRSPTSRPASSPPSAPNPPQCRCHVEPDTNLALRWILVAIAVAQIAVAIPALHLRQRRRPAGAHRAPHRLVRRRARRRVPLRGVEAVAHPRPAAGRRRAGRVPGRVVVARRRRGEHRGRSVRRSTSLDFVGLVGGLAAEPAGAATGAARMTRPRLESAASLALGRARRRVGRRVFAAPASAHATLLSTDPSNGGVYDTPAEGDHAALQRRRWRSSLGGIRVYTSDRERVVTGKPEHPNGQQSVVTTSLPKLDDGTYVVTWRVTSADSHPIDGAYTFQVGSKATLSDKNAKNAAASLLATTGGSRTVGVVYGIDRGRALRRDRAPHRRRGVPRRGVVNAVATTAARAWLVWSGWIRSSGHHRARHRARRHVRRGPPAGRHLRHRACSVTCSTRGDGKVALVRLGLLVLAIPLLRVLLRRRPAAEHPLRVVVVQRRRWSSARASRSRRASPGTRAPASRPGSRSRPTSCTWRAWRAGSAASCVLCFAVLPAPRRRRAAHGAPALLRARAGRDRRAGRVGRVPGVAPGGQHRRAARAPTTGDC